MSMLRNIPSKRVTIVSSPGAEDEARTEVEGHIQPEKGFFEVDTPIFEGDVVELDDPRGGQRRLTVATVKIHDQAPAHMRHIEVIWAS